MGCDRYGYYEHSLSDASIVRRSIRQASLLNVQVRQIGFGLCEREGANRQLSSSHRKVAENAVSGNNSVERAFVDSTS
jgi:hypothetical protein